MSRYILCSECNDWRTSTGVAHAPIYPPVQHSKFRRKPSFPTSFCPGQHFIRKAELSTTTALDFPAKCLYGREGIRSKPQPCDKVHYLKDYLEKPDIPPAPVVPPVPESTYRRAYAGETLVERATDRQPVGPPIGKKIYRYDNEPLFNLEEGGVSVRLDPYNSTSNFLHRPFSARELRGRLFEANAGSFNDTYGLPQGAKKRSVSVLPDIPWRYHPIYDALVFRSKATVRILPRRTEPVPYTAYMSEMKASF